MNITEQQRITAYRQTAESTREFYGSDSLTKHVEILYEKYNISIQFSDFAEVIGDMILGFYKISDLSRMFQEKVGLTAGTSKDVVLELATILEPILNPNDTTKITQKTDLQRLAEQFAEKSRLAQTMSQNVVQVQEAPNMTTAQEPVQTEHEPVENVQPLRTMQGDINRIHGYGAYNEMLEKEGKAHTSTQDATLGK